MKRKRKKAEYGGKLMVFYKCDKNYFINVTKTIQKDIEIEYIYKKAYNPNL